MSANWETQEVEVFTLGFKVYCRVLWKTGGVRLQGIHGDYAAIIGVGSPDSEAPILNAWHFLPGLEPQNPHLGRRVNGSRCDLSCAWKG